MKATLVYITTFVLAFIGVTVALIFANDKFENIFVFDFSPKGTGTEVALSDSTVTDSLSTEDDAHGPEENDVAHNQGGAPNISPMEIQKKYNEKNPDGSSELDPKLLERVKKEIIDSLAKRKVKVEVDTIYQEVIKDRGLIDSLNKVIYAKSTAEKELVYREREITRLKKQLEHKRDSSYDAWVKQTVKLYEGMDAKKAAKILLNYSDNVAKDIVFKMKKKKASEILECLKPEEVVKLTGAQ